MGAANPKAADGLEVNETEDGLVIYVSARDTVHHLNNTAAVIFRLCDGTRDERAIAAELGEIFARDESPLEETQTCLGDLEREGLII